MKSKSPKLVANRSVPASEPNTENRALKGVRTKVWLIVDGADRRWARLSMFGRRGTQLRGNNGEKVMLGEGICVPSVLNGCEGSLSLPFSDARVARVLRPFRAQWLPGVRLLEGYDGVACKRTSTAIDVLMSMC